MITTSSTTAARPADAPSDVAPSDPGRDGRLYAAAGVLMVLASALLATGALLPWVSYLEPSGASIGRTAFQFGPQMELTPLGPIVAGAAVVLALLGMVVAFRPFRPNLVMPLLPTLAAGLMIVQTWQGRFGGVRGAQTLLGPGSFVCYGGLALGLAATALMLPAERPRR